MGGVASRRGPVPGGRRGRGRGPGGVVREGAQGILLPRFRRGGARGGESSAGRGGPPALRLSVGSPGGGDPRRGERGRGPLAGRDRKSVVEGKRVDLGG